MTTQGSVCRGVSSALAMLGVAAAVHAQTTVIYVDDDAPVGGSGATWQAAFRDLQDGLAVVNAAPGSYEVRIGGGVYKPDRAGGDRSESFHAGTPTTASAITLSFAMIGGFAGLSGTDPDLRDPERYETVLTGDLLGNDGPDQLSRDDNSFCVVQVYGFTGEVVLDGLTVTGGNSLSAAYGTFGAGVALVRGATNYSDQSSILVNACKVVGNRSYSIGAAAGATLRAHAVAVKDSIISNNLSAAEYNEGFGGLYIDGASEAAFITGCVIEGNIGGRGGGVYVYRPLVIRRSRICGNYSNMSGGGLYAGEDLRMENCLVAGNLCPQRGGGIFADSVYQADIVNCTIVNNRARYGGGAFLDGYMLGIVNTIAWGNEVDAEGPALVFVQDWGHVFVWNCQVEGGESGLYGFWTNLFWTSNLDSDPLFRDPVSGTPDYRLMQASPCVGVGDPAVRFDDPLDLDGLPRFVGDDQPIARPDIGCYELQNPWCPADFNGDGYTDGLDADGFSVAFDQADPRADINRDGYVDGIDYDQFAIWFDSGC